MNNEAPVTRTAVDRPHPRVSVSGLCFPTATAIESIEAVARLGASTTSLTSGKILDSGAGLVAEAGRRHGVRIGTTTALLRFDLTPGADIDDQLARARTDIDQAVTVGASTVYTLTGRRVLPDWDANVSAYADAAVGVIDYATSKGIRVAVEPTNWLYADLNFVHSFHDALLLGARTGIGVCLDLFHVWTEAELLEDIRKNIEHISHVQISDMTPGIRALPCRDVPGGGDIPLRHIVAEILDAGYEGVFDLELSGPNIDVAGHTEAATTAVAWLSEVLSELGA
ncbi:sugar phosphate isomerase/epimerase family protein [Gordonia insulae]|uniref:Xylose isomerase-like TIM barrel domain-containing protein n=1 Tax=Gordonia insulae TaxID=2420509 RepID=A0A3G8JLZ6_9ACTN|nr:sugar phosphate isomerase/epimerase family protein [Gordonia insulae]AZG45918.1 hypothetical protein D7316_02518 [Gordonia insulae]